MKKLLALGLSALVSHLACAATAEEDVAHYVQAVQGTRPVRVKAIDLPKEVNRSVFERMSTEREREAREHRAKGRELAEGIRADADRQRRVLLAEAYRQSEETRGEGDAKAAAIYAKAYNQDPEFYAFTRSLKAYRDSFADKKDVLVLSPDNEFFRYLEKSKP